ncbi:hypothetical protein TH19_03515 [Thalassospira profundimaris]|uniref:Uncharacterized protein n=2 Tax=Thalassospira TaxID=168934 RepID=A0A367WEH9_9PROT|nr:hypothetical protein TH19_03515 [Thalassospira profundimaris]
MLVIAACLAFGTKPDARAQHAAPSQGSNDIQAELGQFGDIALYVFDGRADFLARIDETLGLGNIKDPETTFAKLPRSPFTITGRQYGKALATCQIFVPANLTPLLDQEIFAQLMRGWFGQQLSYATSVDMTYRWLIYHEVRHCQPDHFGGTDTENHMDERDADLFAFDKLSTKANRNALATDILAFRMITSALFADRAHMTGLSIKRGLAPQSDQEAINTEQEIAAFLATRRLVTAHAKAIAAKATPTNLELIRAITELRERSVAGTIKTDNPLISEILIDLDDAVAHFAPKLHASVATRRSN